MEEDEKKRDFELTEDEQKKRFVFLVKKAQNILAWAKRKKELTSEAKKALSYLRRIIKERAEIIQEGNGNIKIRKKKKEDEKDKIMSMSDPEARMMGKKKNDINPSYKGHIAMNKIGIITYTNVTLATVHDGHHAFTLVGDLKNRGFIVPGVVGDNHYGDMEFRQAMADQNTQVIAPYRKNQVMNSCLTVDIMIEAWAYNHTSEYKDHMRIRSHTEPKQGEMKNFHGMKRANFRGLERVRIQNYMSAIVTNCKKAYGS